MCDVMYSMTSTADSINKVDDGRPVHCSNRCLLSTKGRGLHNPARGLIPGPCSRTLNYCLTPRLAVLLKIATDELLCSLVPRHSAIKKLGSGDWERGYSCERWALTSGFRAIKHSVIVVHHVLIPVYDDRWLEHLRCDLCCCPVGNKDILVGLLVIKQTCNNYSTENSFSRQLHCGMNAQQS